MQKFLNKETLIKNIISFVIIILILIVNGCWNFISLQWNFDRLRELAFWFKILFHLILLILIRFLALNIFLEISRNKNMKLKQEKEKNQALMKLKEEDFACYIDTYQNKKIKIEYWKRKINKKLVKLEKHAKSKDRLIYNDLDNILCESNKYCLKKKELLKQIDDQWIEENYDCLPIKKYPKIEAAMFDLPINSSYDKNNKYQINSKIKNAIMYTMISSCIMLIFLQMMKQSLEQYELNGVALITVLVNMILDFTFIAWQFLSGIFDAFRIVDNQEVIPLINRNRILEEYIYYKSPREETKVKHMLDLIDQSVTK